MNNELHSPTNEAIQKLEEAKKQADKNDTMAKAVLDQLIKRVEDSEALAADILQEHKTWTECRDYIVAEAKKRAHKSGGGNMACIEDRIVYEWAEDYFHKDDKKEEEAAAKKKAEADARRNKAKEVKQLPSQKAGTYAKKEKTEKQESTEPEEKSKNDGMTGQMDIFSMLGI